VSSSDHAAGDFLVWRAQHETEALMRVGTCLFNVEIPDAPPMIPHSGSST